MTIKQLQKRESDLWKMLREETSEHGLEIVAELVEMNILLEQESNK